MNFDYEVSLSTGPTVAARASLANGEYFQLSNGEGVAAYIWSCPSVDVLKRCHTLVSKSQLTSGIRHISLSAEDTPFAVITPEEAITQLTDLEREPQISSISFSFLSGTSLNIERYNFEEAAMASALFFTRHGEPEHVTPSIFDLIDSTASFTMRRIARTLIKDLAERTQSSQTDEPTLPARQLGTATILPFKRPD